MFATEATRCTPEEWAEHRENPRRGLAQIVVHGARGHARGPGASGPTIVRDDGAAEPSREEETPLPVEPLSDRN